MPTLISSSDALYAIAAIISRGNGNNGSSSPDHFSSEIRNGMIAVGLLGLLSFLSTFSLFVFITYRMIYWRRYYEAPISTSQVFILIYNLLLADMQQALGFLLSFHWLVTDGITAPSRACFAQGWLVQIGDVSSGMFVIAIAIHTFLGLVAQRMIPKRLFVVLVIFIWIVCLILTAVGPIVYRGNFFVPSGAWCWINEDYQTERLCLHYIWIFGSQLGALLIYGVIFIILRQRIKVLADHPLGPQFSSTSSGGGAGFGTYKNEGTHTVTTVITTNDPFITSSLRISRAARYMVAYPLVYVALTLPLAAGRVSSMVGNNPSLTYYYVSGGLMASCGFIDVLLYISTRKALLQTSVGVKKAGQPVGRGAAREGAIKLGDVSDGKTAGGKSENLGLGGIMVSRRFSTSDDTSATYSEGAHELAKAGSQRRLVLRDGDDSESV